MNADPIRVGPCQQCGDYMCNCYREVSTEERYRIALREIADFTASRDDPLNPYEQIARHAKETARTALKDRPS
jgi:hypothetical protein